MLLYSQFAEVITRIKAAPYSLSLTDIELSFEFFNYTVVENVAGGQLEVCVKIVNGTLARDVQVHISSSDGTAKGNL